MSITYQPATFRGTHRRPTRPGAPSVRKGLGWSIVVAGLGISALAVAVLADDESPSQSPVARTNTAAPSAASGVQAWYAACLADVTGSADTIEHWSAYCARDAAAHVASPQPDRELTGTPDTDAAAKTNTATPSTASGVQAWYAACLADVRGSADTIEHWSAHCAREAAAHVVSPQPDRELTGTADTLERTLPRRK